MSKRKRGRTKAVAHRRKKTNVGAGQSQQTTARPSVEAPEVRDGVTELNSVERPDRGGGRGGAAGARAEGEVGGDLRDVQTNEGDGTAEERWGEWPYRIVRTPEDLLAFGEWLQVLGGEVEKTPVGAAINQSELALATKAQGWTLPFSSWSPVAQGILERVLLAERTAPALVTRDTVQFTQALEDWLDHECSAALSNIKHDMSALEYATGRAVARDMTPLKDALDCAVVGPAMALGAPPFYHQVGMPLVRFNSQIRAVEQEGARWVLTYEGLMFRVLAHYTRDPVLTQWLQDGLNPIQEFTKCLETETVTEAMTFLLWMVCGEDEELLSKHYPIPAINMPEAPQLIKAAHVDKKLPALRMGLIRLVDQYATARRTTTLYGRHSPWGMKPQELLHFVLMGSVNDLLDVCMASIAKMGSTTHWLSTEGTYDYWHRAQIIGYNGEVDPIQWQHQLEELGSLNNPLGMVPLSPTVSVDG